VRSGQRRGTWFLAVSLVVGACITIQTAEPKEATTQVKQVALFKNGIGYFLRTGEWPEEAGPFVIRPLPASSHGSFWLTWDAEVKVNDLHAREALGTEPAEATSVADLLRANAGEKVRLYLSATGTGAEMRTVEGVILPPPEVTKAPRSDPYASGRPSIYTERYVPPPAQPDLLLLDTGKGIVAVKLPLVQEVDFLSGKVSRSVPRKVDTVELVGSVEGAPKKRGFTLTYLAKGATWAPSYQIDISKPDTAVMSAKAEVINEVEDLKGVTLQLVTGFPNLQFADVPSPLSLKLDLAQFFQYLVRPPEQRPPVTANVMTQSVVYRPAPTPALPGYQAAAAGGETAEDLFLYPIKEVTLAKGEVGYFPLFSASIPYQHVYQWTVPDYVRRSDSYAEAEGRAETRAKPAEVVWHTLRLQNTTDLPWTTAPAMTVAQGQVLGQDTLTYTPARGSVTLKVTQAVGIGAWQEENEVQRERQAVQFYGRAYDRVTIEGKLRVHNYKGEPVSLEVTKTFSGELKSSTPEAQVRQLAQGLKELNPTSTLTWQLTVKPGEEKELTYSYATLVSR
jgi:hypothetical protein